MTCKTCSQDVCRCPPDRVRCNCDPYFSNGRTRWATAEDCPTHGGIAGRAHAPSNANRALSRANKALIMLNNYAMQHANGIDVSWVVRVIGEVRDHIAAAQSLPSDAEIRKLAREIAEMPMPNPPVMEVYEANIVAILRGRTERTK